MMKNSDNAADSVTSDKTFGRLGPPPGQPRRQKFVPKCGKVGRGTRKMRRDEDATIQEGHCQSAL